MNVHDRPARLPVLGSKICAGWRTPSRFSRLPWRAFAVGCVATISLAGAIVVSGMADATPSQWSITPSPDQLSSDGGFGFNELNGVSCATRTYCEAVGGGPQGTVVMNWNGTAWALSPNPVPRELFGVSCTTTEYCVAVGVTIAPSGYAAPLILNDGQVTTSPSPGNGGGQLDGVSCTSATNCVAVGFYQGPSRVLPLIESWNGTAWSVMSSRNPGYPNSTYLQSVSCASSTSCLAVGFDTHTTSLNFAEYWNGKTWTITSPPNRHGIYATTDELTGVTCPTSTACIAVGSYVLGRYAETLIESWNGKTWKINSSPNPFSNTSTFDGFMGCGQGGSYLLCSVSCRTSTSCVAVGTYNYQAGGYERALIESWNGSTWSVTPNPTRSYSSLFGTSCPEVSFCVAVGLHAEAGVNYPQNLVVIGT